LGEFYETLKFIAIFTNTPPTSSITWNISYSLPFVHFNIIFLFKPAISKSFLFSLNAQPNLLSICFFPILATYPAHFILLDVNTRLTFKRRIKSVCRLQALLGAHHLTPLYPQTLALTSATGGGRSVGIVRSRTKATEFFFSVCNVVFLYTSFVIAW